MRKNGFTLIELLAVLTILAALSLLLVPVVSTAIKNFKQDAYDDQVKTIELAAKNFGTDYLYTLEFAPLEKIKITLGQLKGLGYIEYQFLNPIDKSRFPDDMTITITKQGSALRYQVNENSGTATDYTEEKQPTLSLKGDTISYLGRTEPFVDLGVEVGNTSVSTVRKTYTKNGVTASGVTNGSPGVYAITYSITDGPAMTSIIRTVVIK